MGKNEVGMTIMNKVRDLENLDILGLLRVFSLWASGG